MPEVDLPEEYWGVTRVLFFVPWCVAIGAAIVLFPTHADAVRASLCGASAQTTHTAYAHVCIFAAALFLTVATLPVWLSVRCSSALSGYAPRWSFVEFRHRLRGAERRRDRARARSACRGCCVLRRSGDPASMRRWRSVAVTRRRSEPPCGLRSRSSTRFDFINSPL